MKKTTTIFLALSLVIFIHSWASGQLYQPMPTQNATWSSVRCWYFYPGGWHDEYSISLNGTDTTFNSRVYTKLFLTTHHAPGTAFDSVYTNFLGGMREVNRRVYFFSDYLCNDTTERLIYDFNAGAIGDTIRTQVLSNLTDTFVHVVVGIDSMQIGSIYHRRLLLADTNGIPWESWTEGIGSSFGLAYSTYNILSDNSYDLTCFRVKSQVLYSNPTPYYSYCTPPLPVIICDSMTNGVPRIPESNSFSIVPNPARDYLIIPLSLSNLKVRVYNSIGKEQQISVNSGQVSLRDLPSGIYFIQFIGKQDEIISSSRFVHCD